MGYELWFTQQDFNQTHHSSPITHHSKGAHMPKKTDLSTPCETCAYYDVIYDDGTMGCTIDIDEDDCYREKEGSRRGCPFYKFYDEYKTVQKQN